MQNRFLTYLVFGAVSLIALGASPNNVRAEDLLDMIQKEGKIVAATSSNIPIAYVDNNTNEAVGFLPDVLSEFLRRQKLDVKVDAVLMSFSSLIPSLRSGRIDIMIDSMYIKPERAEVVDFTDMIYYSPEAMVVADQGGLDPKNLTDLCGHSAGTYQGTVYVGDLEAASKKCETGKTIEVKTYPTIQNVLADLSAKRIEAALVDSTVVAHIIKQDPKVGFRIAENYVPANKASTACAFAVKKGESPKFLAAFNERLKEMKADGTIDKLLTKWGQTPVALFTKL